jgi:uncharacterized protein YceK
MNKYLLVIFTGLTIILSGCGGLSTHQKVELDTYKTQMKEACIKKASSKQSCESRANRFIEVDQDYFLLYNEDKMLKKCKNKNIEKETKCLKEIQNKHYQQTAKDFIKKI